MSNRTRYLTLVLIVPLMSAMPARLLSAQDGIGFSLGLRSSQKQAFVDISPDGKTAVSGDMSSSSVHLWDMETGKALWTVVNGEPGASAGVRFSPDGKSIAMIGMNGLSLRVAQTGSLLREYKTGEITIDCGLLSRVDFSPDGRMLLLYGRRGKQLYLLDTATGEILLTLSGHSGVVRSHAFSPDGTRIISGAEDATIRVWDAATGKQLRILTGHTDKVTSVSVSPDGRTILSGSWDGTVRLWNLADGVELMKLMLKPGTQWSLVSTVRFSPDGRSIMALYEIGSNCYFRSWDSATGTELFTLHNRLYGRADLTPDGKYILAGSGDSTLRLVDLRTGLDLREFGPRMNIVDVVALSPDLKSVVYSGNESGSLSFVDPATGQELNRLKLKWPETNVGAAQFTPDGRTLVYSTDKYLIVYDMETSVATKTINGPFFGFIKSLSLSPDGRTALIGSSNGTLSLLDLASGAELRTLKHAPEGSIVTAWSPDGTLVASADRNFNNLYIKVWNPVTGQEVFSLTEPGGGVRAVVFSPDGKLLLSTSREGTIRLWDMTNGRHLRTFSGHEAPVTSLCFAPDGNTFYSGSKVGELKHWNTTDGKELPPFAGHTGGVNSLSISLDGSLLVSGSEDGTLRFWNTGSGSWTGALASLYDTGYVTFTPDGFFDGSPEAIKEFVYSKVGGIVIPGPGAVEQFHAPKVLSARFSHAVRQAQGGVSPGRTVFRSGNAGAATAIEMRIQTSTSDSYYNTMQDIDIAPGGTEIALIGKKQSYSFEIGSCTIRSLPDLGFSDLGSEWLVAYSPDGRYLYLARTSFILQLDTVLKQEVRRISCKSYICRFRLSPDGKTIAAALADDAGHYLYLYDTTTGRELKRFTTGLSYAFCFAFSPDGKTLAAGTGELLTLWDVATGKEKLSVPASYSIGTVEFSPDGRAILCSYRLKGGGDTEHLKLIDTETGKEIMSYRTSESIGRAVYSPDGQTILATSSNFLLFDAATGKQLAVFKGHNRAVIAVCFFPDGKRFATASTDGTCTVWDLSSGKEICTILTIKGKWIIFTPDGYWDGSQDCSSLVMMGCGLSAYRIDQFAVRNNRPDIIAERMGLSSAVVDTFRAAYRKRLRRMGIEETDLSRDYRVPKAAVVSFTQNLAEAGGKYAELSLEFTSDGRPLSRYQVYVNDVPLYGAAGKPVSGDRAMVMERVELTKGENKIEVSCTDAGMAESYRAVHSVFWKGDVKPDLYFLAFGVSEYADPAIRDLRYAAKDARDLEAAFQKMAGSVYGSVKTRVLTDAQVTRKALTEAGEFLKPARPDDVFVLFISGHGVQLSGSGIQSGERTYYFITSDARLSNIPDTAVEFDQIEALLQGIGPRSKLFLMDTCESGEGDEYRARAAAGAGKGIYSRTLEQEVVRGLSVERRAASVASHRERWIYNDLVRRSGAIVFSSCRGDESALEADSWRQGAFTYSILKALKGDVADRNRDRVLSTDELRSYVMESVPALVKSEVPTLEQHPTVDRDNISVSFGFPVVER